MRKMILLSGCLLLLLSDVARAQQDGGARWYKGNTHTHTLNSDGDSTPEEVVRWYREHKYNFLVLTDHNYLTAVDGLNAVHGAADKFLVIRGEELTDSFNRNPIHINGLDVRRLVKPQGGASVAETIQRDVDEIRAAQGVPHINHPNFHWAITAEDLKQVRNDKLFEVYNGHPHVNNLGGGGMPGLEEMWDILLTHGKQLYGIAVDDAHHFKRPGDPLASGPGRGWVMVRAEQLTAEAILAALERGDFYASTGVELEDYRASQKQITIRMKTDENNRYRVQFIGREGKVLRETTASPAVYDIQGNEGYVRARVIESNGRMAWTQPVFTGRR
ncbi:MAG: CehA/McbA family metallohydrolase [Blastocatellia bacterium]